MSHERILEQLRGRPLPKSLRWNEVVAAFKSFGVRVEERPRDKAWVYIPGHHPIAIAHYRNEIGIGAIKELSLALWPATDARPPFEKPAPLPTPPRVITLKEALDKLPDPKPAATTEVAPAPEPEKEVPVPTPEEPKPEEPRDDIVRFEATTPTGTATCVIDRADWDRLTKLVDARLIKATATSVYVGVGSIIDPQLRAQATSRNLHSVQLAHLVLDVEPGTARIFRKDGNPYNLRRSNLPLSPTQRPAPATRSAASTFEIRAEVTTRYVLRIDGAEIGRYDTEEAARLALAERLLGTS